MSSDRLAGPRLPLAAGLALGLVGLLAWQPIPVGAWHDDGVYALLGKALARGEGLRYVGVPGAPPAAKFPPLYPAVLAGLWSMTSDPGVFTRLAEGLNMLLLATAGGLFALVLRARAGLSSAAAFTAAVLGFLHLELWWSAFVPMSEPLFVLVFMLALLSLPAPARPARVGTLAVLLIVLVYVRTAGVALVAGVAVALWVEGRRRAAAAAALAPAAALIPWLVWSGGAAEALPEPVRDILGGYGGWLTEQVAGDPAGFAVALPGHVLRLGVIQARGLAPGVTGEPLLWLAPAAWLAAAVGLWALGRRVPSLGWAGAFYLALVVAWPFLDPRLVAPVIPLIVAGVAVLLGDLARARGAGVRRAVAVFALAFAVASLWRILGPGATAPQRVRSNQLAAALEAVTRFTPPDAVVGAPELWAAIPLYTGRSATPSARFLPTAHDRPVWGRPDEQAEIWERMGVEFLVTEAGGRVHGETLDRIAELCPGSLPVLARWEGQALVRLAWDDACRRRMRVR